MTVADSSTTFFCSKLSVRCCRLLLLNVLAVLPFQPRVSALETHSAPLEIYLFASSTCRECMRVKHDLLPLLSAKYGNHIAFRHIKLDDIDGFELLLKYEKFYKLDNDASLKVFVGDAALCGEKSVMNKLEQVVEQQLYKGAYTITPDDLLCRDSDCKNAEPEDLAEERFSAFKPSAIALAGFLDGINPCAFTTLVFFVSLLVALRKSRRQIVTVGLCFAAAVFATYTVLGVGTVKALQIFSISSNLSRGLSVAVAVLALIFAVYSFYDFIIYRRTGKTEKLILKLPESLRKRITRMISSRMRTRNLLAGALVLGVLVSLFESLCTGQVYLPTLTYIVQDRGLASNAGLWLILYNLMFILPLLLIFALVVFGVTSDKLLALNKSHLGSAKLLMSALFLLLGCLLLSTLIN